ncbi:MAG TPA: hypothetical protein VKB68_20895 [Stellaceae bacterium]|nr:hypothetical protein [Stellaceae bacterium]
MPVQLSRSHCFWSALRPITRSSPQPTPTRVVTAAEVVAWVLALGSALGWEVPGSALEPVSVSAGPEAAPVLVPVRAAPVPAAAPARVAAVARRPVLGLG